jgi:hypothetical protein
MSEQPVQPSQSDEVAVEKEAWVKPEIVSIQPVSSAQGRGAAAGDGTSNLS